MVSAKEINAAAQIIRAGGLVAFPTETVYGLGANACDAAAVRNIFELKGRPATSPVIVHVASVAQAQKLAAEWPREAQELASKFWPGPLTIVVPKNSLIPDVVTAGLTTVGLRMPKSEIALALIREAGVPIAAPSANRFAQLSPTTAQHVCDAFGNEAPMILDGGACEVGLESTVVAVVDGRVELLRPGMVFVQEAVAAAVQDGMTGAHRSPGQHKKHYSPRTKLILVNDQELPECGRGAFLAWSSQAAKLKSNCQRVVVMPLKAAEYAAQLYKTLHELDGGGYDWIAVEYPPQTAEWSAIWDRLRRATQESQ